MFELWWCRVTGVWTERVAKNMMTTCGWHRHSEHEIRDRTYTKWYVIHSLHGSLKTPIHPLALTHAWLSLMCQNHPLIRSYCLPHSLTTRIQTGTTHTHTVIHKTNSLSRELIHSYRISLAENARIGSSNNDQPCRAANGPSPVTTDGGLPPPSLISTFSAYIYVSCKTNWQSRFAIRTPCTSH